VLQLYERNKLKLNIRVSQNRADRWHLHIVTAVQLPLIWSCACHRHGLSASLLKVSAHSFPLIRAYSQQFPVIPAHSRPFPPIPLHFRPFPLILGHSCSFPLIPAHSHNSRPFPLIHPHPPTFLPVPAHSLSFSPIPAHSCSFPPVPPTFSHSYDVLTKPDGNIIGRRCRSVSLSCERQSGMIRT